jgi:tetratricopeptide (TPR) repeat protein
VCIFATYLKDFAKQASMAYDLSAAQAAEINDGNLRHDLFNRNILEKALTQAQRLSGEYIEYTETSALDYAMALMELARAYAIYSDLDQVGHLFAKIPRKPSTAELDFIVAETAYLLGELLLKQGQLDRATSIYEESFPVTPSLGPELIRLDLAALLISVFLEKGELENAKEMFFSYVPDNEINFFCPVPHEKLAYARVEFSRALSKIALKLINYAEKTQDLETLSTVGAKLKIINNAFARLVSKA